MMILITGASGQLGTDILQVFQADGVIGVDEEDFDIAEADSTEILIGYHPDLVIHAAAYTDVDGCERDPGRAFRVNAEGTRHVVEACRVLGVPLVYVSTDYVFDGSKQLPYTEEDLPHPLNIYGASKLKGEEHVRATLDCHYIVRTAWLYGRGGRNFVKAILGKAQRGETLRIVDDQVGSPTWAKDLASAIAQLIQGARFGTYHITNAGECSWYEFAERILDVAGLNGRNPIPISSAELGRAAPRPAYSVLANQAWERHVGPSLRSWQEVLDAAIQEIMASERSS